MTTTMSAHGCIGNPCIICFPRPSFSFDHLYRPFSPYTGWEPHHWPAPATDTTTEFFQPATVTPKTAVKCPVCIGVGEVAAGIDEHGKEVAKQCHGCAGKGWVAL